jgi:hypothetical protein
MTERVLGEIFPFSVATAISFEKLQEYKQIRQFNAIYVNLRTLVRNAYSCIGKDNVTSQNLIESVTDDITKMSQVVNNHFGHLNLIIYYNTNAHLRKLFPYNQMARPTTPKQIAYHAILEKVTKVIIEKYKESIVKIDTLLKPKRHEDIGIVLTNFPTELLSAKYFRHLVLLESHTGAVKGRLEWNTKLTNGRSLINIPYCKLTLAVFGDNKQLLLPMGRDVKEAIKDIASKGKWTTNTSNEKIRYTISSYADIHSRRELLKLF